MQSDMLQIILQAGALGVLVLVLVGIGWLAWKTTPSVVEFFRGLVSEQRATKEVLVALAAEQHAGFAAIEAKVEARISLAEQRIGVIVDRASKDVVDVVRERASHTGDEIREELRRTTSGEREVTETPARGIPRLARGGSRS